MPANAASTSSFDRPWPAGIDAGAGFDLAPQVVVVALRQRLREIDAHLVQQNARPVDEVIQEVRDLTLEVVTRQIADGEIEIEEMKGQVEAAETPGQERAQPVIARPLAKL